MMNCKSSMIYLLFSTLLTLQHQSHSFSFVEPLYEGSPCALEQGGTGICQLITDCPSRLKQARLGHRNQSSKDRCGFSGFTEIVCCPLQDLSQKIGIRPADLACRQYENEISSVFLVFHILNGEEAQSGEFPFMAALGYLVTDDDSDKDDKDGEDKIKYDCGGTLISKEHVLTAAHCVNNIEERVPIQVLLGSNNVGSSDSEDVQRIAVGEVITHPTYRRSLFYNDIAIIKLKKPVRVTGKVKPICLQTTPVEQTVTRLGENASFIVTGWGATGFGEQGSPVLLKTPSMSLIERKNCASFYKGFRRLSRGFDSAMICAMDTSETENRADACQGDSGGPLLMITNNNAQQTVVGVTSFGQICGTSVPAVYMNVYSYLDWIESVVWPDNNNND